MNMMIDMSWNLTCGEPPGLKNAGAEAFRKRQMETATRLNCHGQTATMHNFKKYQSSGPIKL
jgi:hypothetical protein